MPNNFRNLSVEEVVDFCTLRRNPFTERVSQEDFSGLTSRINNLAHRFNLSQVGLVLNGLANIQHDKNFLKTNLDIINLTWVLDQNLIQEIEEDYVAELKASDIIGLITGCANLGYDKDELSWNLELLSNWINCNINKISPKGALSLLRSFAKMGYEADDRYLAVALKKIVGKAKSGIEEFKAKDAADLIHSLAKSKMFDELFDEHSGEIFRTVQLAKRIIWSSRYAMKRKTAYSLLQAELFCKSLAKPALFENEEIKYLKDHCPKEVVVLTRLQRELKECAETRGFTATAEEPLYPPIREIDLVCEDARRVYHIECDGPPHFPRGNLAAQPNSDTRNRNHINKWLIAAKIEERSKLAAQTGENIKQHYYVVMPSNLAGRENLWDEVESRKEEIRVAHIDESKKKNKRRRKNKTAAQQTMAESAEVKVQAVSQAEQVLPIATVETADSQLKAAIEARDSAVVRSILTQGLVDVNAHAPGTEFTFLGYAFKRLLGGNNKVAIGNLRVIEALISAGASYTESEQLVDLDKEDVRASSFLTKTLDAGIYNATALILSRFRVSVNADAFISIINTGYLELIAKAVANFSGDIGGRFNIEIWDAVFKNENSDEMAEVLIKAGITPIEDSLRSKLMSQAIKAQNENLVIKLVEDGIVERNIFTGDASGNLLFYPPLLIDAVVYSSESILDILLEKMGGIQAVSNDPIASSFLVNLASIKGHESFVTEMVRSKKELLTLNLVAEHNILTPIHSAAIGGQVNIMKILCEIADKNEIERYFDIEVEGITPLHKAVNCGEEDAACYLISLGANIEAIALDSGETPIHIATRTRQASVARALLEAGANPNSVSNNGEMPLHIAARSLNVEVCEALISYGADVNADSRFRFGRADPLRIALSLIMVDESSNVIDVPDPGRVDRARKIIQMILDTHSYRGPISTIASSEIAMKIDGLPEMLQRAIEERRGNLPSGNVHLLGASLLQDSKKNLQAGKEFLKDNKEIQR